MQLIEIWSQHDFLAAFEIIELTSCEVGACSEVCPRSIESNEHVEHCRHAPVNKHRPDPFDHFLEEKKKAEFYGHQ